MMKPHSHPKHDAKEEKKEHPGKETQRGSEIMNSDHGNTIEVVIHEV